MWGSERERAVEQGKETESERNREAERETARQRVRAVGRPRYLDSVEQLSIQVERGHAVLKHAFTHHHHQVMPLALQDLVPATDPRTAGKKLIERPLLSGLISYTERKRGERDRNRDRERVSDQV